MELMRREGVFLPADCNGRGTCGKCRVRFAGEAKWVKACETQPDGAFTVEYEDREESLWGEEELAEGAIADTQALAAVVDLGTTTIEAAVVDLKTRKALSHTAVMNRQRSYGADVVSRIDEANKGKLSDLQRIVRTDVERLLERLHLSGFAGEVVLTGNTAMQYLFEGRSCEEIMKPPFHPAELSLRKQGQYILLPGLTSFIGADVLCGVLHCGMDQKEELSLLLDLGTNGEMALGNKNRILAASTAAGPALEGGNISCGMPALKGAISGMRFDGENPELFVIGDENPVGICGSGVIETLYELRMQELVDETGWLKPPYEETGFPLAEAVSFTQKDIREVQLAKSAVRAGVETLMKSYGCEPEDIATVYLAGGLGKGLDPQKAAGIGLLPAELAEKTESIGNSALAGACLAATDPSARKRLEALPSLMEELPLSDSPIFADLFMKFMVL